MIDTFKQHVTPEQFINDGRSFKSGNKSDYISYLEFVKYFSDLTEIKKHNLIIGINFSYGWMPTCFDFRSDNFKDAVDILNRTKQGMVPTVEELMLLKGLFNNSLVGTSKLLHFINPNIIAIWDSRVYRYLTEQEYYEDRKGICEAFLDYLKFCDLLTQPNEYNQIHSFIEGQVGYPMTKLRTAELIMYSKGAKPR
jgi:hypothetical protein